MEHRRINELERLTRSLTLRVDRLEGHAATRPVPVPRPVPIAGPAPVAPPVPMAPPANAGPSTPGAAGPPIAAGAGPSSTQGLEDLLGGRMLAWLGGVAVVVGLALFFAYAITRGWIDESARALSAGVASIGLLGLGVWLHEHRGRTDAARTVAAVAVAGLFMTVVVASRVYALIPVALGLGLAGAIGAAAAALSIRWSARVIGAIGIIGALLSPVLVGAPSDGATLAFLFTAALSAVGVLLWHRWDWLGFAVLLVCAPQWLVWLWDGPTVAGALVVLIAFGALGIVAAIGFAARLPQTKLAPASSLLLALNAAVLAIAGRTALIGLGHPDAGDLWVAALAAAHLLLGLLFGRLPRVSADIRLLVLTLGVLLGDVAFALLAQGPILAAGWAAITVLFARVLAGVGERRHDLALAELGLGGHIALALLVAIGQAAPMGVLGRVGEGQITATITLAAVAGAAFASARLTATIHEWWRTALNTIGLGVVAFMTAINLEGVELVLAWALEAVALAKLARRTGDEVASIAALTFLAGAAGHTLAIEAPPGALVLGAPDSATAAVALGACAAASLTLAHARLTIRDRLRPAALIGVGAVTLLYLASLLLVTAFQPSGIETSGAVLDLTVRQQGQMLLSGFWALAGVGALLAGLRGERRRLRRGALGLLLITAGKVFLYDLSTLDSVYRIASFVGLGLLLLVGAYAYQRLRPRAAPDLRTVPRALR